MVEMLLELIKLLVLDAIFIGVCVLLLAPLVVYKQAAYAVLKRNFIGYFSNPTGYVFLCLFVLLTSTAAFWPHEFFNANLANLDQLNKFLPFIMLIFIPAITMSIWSEERRQGTDELLLTLPADDFDIVIGKYLAAASIFTASLLFSQLCNYAVLISLTMGHLDAGLLFTNYFGYWMIGLAMLAIGMIASFLTSNMTVGFVLGCLFNVPLVFAIYADAIIPWTNPARIVASWSVATQFEPFGRGVISSAGVIYFGMLAAIGLYISMVLIGARHWSGGRDGDAMLGHYLLRGVALIVIALAANLVVSRFDPVRLDATEGRVSSLSPQTKRILSQLKNERPIVIEAFLSREVPEAYVKTKFELISMLNEFSAMSRGKVQVRMHSDLEPFSEQAVTAEQRFGIRPQTVRTRSRGTFKDEEVILGAAFTSGLEKVVVPFFDYGIPVEYELIRSIGTVGRKDRKKIGVVRTDAQLMGGGFTMQGGQPRMSQKQDIITELEKQYDVEEVDPTSPITPDKYDVLLAVQPSSLGPQEMNNFVEAVRSGQPAAIFEDPRPAFMGNVPGTGDPKRPPGGGMFGMGGGAPQPKGDIRQLWKTIGIEQPGEAGFDGGLQPDLAWQKYIPYQKLQIQGIPETWVFVRNEAPGGEETINSADPITSGLEEIFLPTPGVIQRAANVDNLKFTKLLSTGTASSGRVSLEAFQMGQEDPRRLTSNLGKNRGEQILAVRITSDPDKLMAAESADEKAPGPKDTAPKKKGINVVYVADIDLMISTFLRIRARPEEDPEINWKFENVTFLLNAIDTLSGDEGYIDIRKRKSRHSTLQVVEARVNAARDSEFKQAAKFGEDFDNAVKAAEAENKEVMSKLQGKVEDLKKKQQAGEQVNFADLRAAMDAAQMQQQALERKLQVRREQLQRDRDTQIERIRRQTDLEVLRIQNWYKFWALLLPPIPPLLVGLIVFVYRRLREREGVSKARLR